MTYIFIIHKIHFFYFSSHDDTILIWDFLNCTSQNGAQGGGASTATNPAGGPVAAPGPGAGLGPGGAAALLAAAAAADPAHAPPMIQMGPAAAAAAAADPGGADPAANAGAGDMDD